MWLEQIIAHLHQNARLLFITGAGISVESGIRAYRGTNGVWTENKEIDGVPVKEIMTGMMIRSRPELTWKGIAQSELIIRNAQCNEAHYIISEMESHFAHVVVYTQNIDGLHHKAGCKNVIEIHGGLRDLYCRQCDYSITVDNYAGLQIPPLCPECSHWLRPDTVLFGEMIPGRKLVRFAEELQRGFDIVFVIGTSCNFPHVQGPILKAKERNMLTVEINPEKTWASDKVDIYVPLTASTALKNIWQRYSR